MPENHSFYQKAGFIFLTIFIFVWPGKYWGQEINLHQIDPGNPYSQQFLATDYQAHRQNWCFAQDSLGLIYVGNSSNLMIYDGTNWELLSTPNSTVVRSLAKDENGRIYYGAKGDFGYLKKNDNGSTELISLAQKLPEPLKDFNDIWDIHSQPGKMTFQSFNYFFQLNHNLIGNDDSLHHFLNKGFSVIKRPKASFVFSSSLNGNIVFQEYEKGLFYLKSGEPEFIPNSEFLAKIPLLKMIPFPYKQPQSNDHSLICSQYNGLFRFKGNSFEKFTLSLEGESFFKQNNISDILDLGNGSLLISSYNKGLMQVNLPEKKTRIIDAQSGLIPSDAVSGMFIDNQDGVWVSTNHGLARLEFNSSISYFTTHSGLKGNIFDIKRHQGNLFLATSSGLFELSKEMNFRQSGKMRDQCFSLLSSHNDLLAAFGPSGLWSLKPNQNSQIITKNNTVLLSQSQYDSSIVWVGQEKVGDGFSLLYRTGNTWKSIPTNPPIPAQIRYIAEEAPGIIWLGSASNGYFRVEVPALQLGTLDPSSQSSIDISFTEIPYDLSRARLFKVNGNVFMGTNNGLKYYDYASKSLQPELSFGDSFADSTTKVLFMTEGKNKHVLLRSNLTKSTFSRLFPKPNGSYQHQPINIDLHKDGFYNQIYPDPQQSEIVWFGGTEKLLRYDFSTESLNQQSYAAIIRKILVNNDSLIFGEGVNKKLDASTKHILPYEKNAVRFEFSALHYSYPQKTEYQFFLEGFDENWSEWNLETRKDYTNLPEGFYSFKIKARNIYEQESKMDSFTFSVLPPWYRTWWAYLFYLILAIGLIYLILKWRARQYQEENKKLEHIIIERTQELREKNQKLQELDSAKSRLFTNISHEFRTPLTVILGTADQIEENPENSVSRKIQMIRRNGHQLLNLVNQILQLQKLESGTLEVELIQGDIISYFKYIAESFESLAENKKIAINFLSKKETLVMDYDTDKWLRIISNLLSNAIKFTEEGGQISFQIDELKENEQPFLLINIRDTGMGVSKEQLPYIFDRFYQIDDSVTRAAEGTGIGLALVRELIHLMNGEISVASEYGKGTTFTLKIPITNQASFKTESASDAVISQSGLKKSNEADTLVQTIPSQQNLPSILIIEDNLDVVTYLKDCLKETYRIEVATDGKTGIEKAIELIPDFVISDVMMPEKDGFEVCEILKNDERTSHIPIILLTARADFESKISGLERGADAYLTKPFKKAELLIRIEKLLEIREKLRTRYRNAESLKPSKNGDIQIEDAFITKFTAIIHQHIDDETFKVPELCKEIGISRSQLHNKIKALTGLPTTHYIRLIRLRKANELLANPRLSISEIAYMIGFSDPGYFSKLYFQEYGKRPREARKEL